MVLGIWFRWLVEFWCLGYLIVLCIVVFEGDGLWVLWLMVSCMFA